MLCYSYHSADRLLTLIVYPTLISKYNDLKKTNKQANKKYLAELRRKELSLSFPCLLCVTNKFPDIIRLAPYHNKLIYQILNKSDIFFEKPIYLSGMKPPFPSLCLINESLNLIREFSYQNKLVYQIKGNRIILLEKPIYLNKRL